MLLNSTTSETPYHWESGEGGDEIPETCAALVDNPSGKRAVQILGVEFGRIRANFAQSSGKGGRNWPDWVGDRHIRPSLVKFGHETGKFVSESVDIGPMPINVGPL